MSLPSYIFDHVDKALDAIVTVLKKQRIEGFITVCAEEVQQLEDVLWMMIAERFIDSAVGAQLDQYGKLVGEDRDGLTDGEYRAFIKARILSNLSNGEVDRLTEILSTIGSANGPVRYYPLYPAGMWFEYESDFAPSTASAARIVEQMTEVAPAGVQVAYITQGSVGMFRFDTPGAGFDGGTFGGTL